MTPNAQITVTTMEIPANKELGTEPRLVFYLIIETEKGKTVMNIGEKTYKKIIDLTTKTGGKK